MLTTYTILGGTGATGSELISYLLNRQPFVHLNIYVRSSSKLYTLFPDLQTSPNITIFTGSIDETPVLASCIRSATAIFCTIAQNKNEPDCSLSQRTAHAVILALTQLRSESAHPATYTAPPLVWPSSAALNPAFEKRIPAALRAVALRAAFHVLQDLRLAAEYLGGFEWSPVSFWQPRPIVKDEARGVSLTAEKRFDLISYADVARGIVKIVEEGDGMWIGKEVGFVALGGKKVKNLPPSTFIWILAGLLGYCVPSLWLAGRKIGL
ncbi:uncharacterized protein LY89DRAFT_764479 [Mollisia scopiformis]|uniref:NAD(P)-binding domain-containing protein n=1 Tax=Mollisia scopiformis TaxID=149040 RepID=A0A132B807_MOLSC|nr:uncharacterized protein LY89DRAFT_764479 [Mollisia scopiformis]KUJ08383.1 hypothetical protein LY89DRAFT_764479 [Mollisia scopiformis]